MCFSLPLRQSLWGKPFSSVFTQRWLTFSIASGFNTTVDVKLQQWAEKELPRRCVAIGQRVLLDEFQSLIDRELKKAPHDPIADDLKTQVVQACRTRHQWDTKALDSLVSLAVLLRHSTISPLYFSASDSNTSLARSKYLR